MKLPPIIEVSMTDEGRVDTLLRISSASSLGYGFILAKLAIDIADMFHEEIGVERAVVLNQLRAMFNSELMELATPPAAQSTARH